MTRYLVVDDDPLTRRTIEFFLRKLDDRITCVSAGTGFEAVQALGPGRAFDGIFLDLELPELDGVSILQILPPGLPVVIVSARSDFGAASYEFDVVDYLVKPLEFPRFKKAFERLRAAAPEGTPVPDEPATDSRRQAASSIFVKSGSEIVRLAIDEILFIRADSNYATFHLAGRKPLMVLASLRKLGESLPDKFVRIHRSYIVNVSHISRVEGSSVHVDGQEIPIGESHRQALLERLDPIA